MNEHSSIFKNPSIMCAHSMEYIHLCSFYRIYSYRVYIYAEQTHKGNIKLWHDTVMWSYTAAD